MKIIKIYRRQIYALCLLFVIALSQSTIIYLFRIFDVKPDIILAAVVIFVPFFSLRWALIFGFLGGIFRDIFSVLPFGLNIILCILWVIVARRIYRQFSFESNLTRSAIVGLIVLLNNLAFGLMLFVIGRPLPISVFLRVVFIESALSMLLAFPMNALFVYIFEDPLRPARWISRMLYNRFLPALERLRSALRAIKQE